MRAMRADEGKREQLVEKAGRGEAREAMDQKRKQSASL
jgi:hypothetical protein